jgi:hypothetical protein
MFALDLLNEWPTDSSIDFLLKYAIDTDEIEQMLLNFAATQGDEFEQHSLGDTASRFARTFRTRSHMPVVLRTGIWASSIIYKRGAAAKLPCSGPASNPGN